MKKVLSTLFVAIFLMSCSKEKIATTPELNNASEIAIISSQPEGQDNCNGCDVIIENPGDGGGGSGGSNGGGDSYSGNSNCGYGYFTITHNNIYSYTISFSITGSDFSSPPAFSSSFTFLTPNQTGTVTYRQANYNSTTGIITIFTSYVVVTKTRQYIRGNWETVETAEYFNKTDLINTCANQVTVGS